MSMVSRKETELRDDDHLVSHVYFLILIKSTKLFIREHSACESIGDIMRYIIQMTYFIMQHTQQCNM